MSRIGVDVAFAALWIAFDGDMLAWIYCGLISGYTASSAMFVGTRRLDVVLGNGDNCERFFIFKVRAALRS